jgi:hypothetical protein
MWCVACTGNASLLVEGHSYLNEHWTQEAGLGNASYYWPTHDNSAWQAATLLLTQQQHQTQQPPGTAASAMANHHRALSALFSGWLAGRVRPRALC